jgi:paraquat-inducible protein B
VDDGTTVIPVYIEVEPDSIVFVGDAPRDDDRQLHSLIERGMRAQLAAQSLLTGKMFILFDMHPDTPIVLRGKNPQFVEIPTIPSMMEEMTGVLERLQKLPVEQLIADLRHAIQGADELVRSPDLAHAIVSVDEAVQSFNALAKTVDAEVKPISNSLQDTAAAVRNSLKNLDERLVSVEEALSGTLRDFQKLAQDVDAQIEPLMSTVNQVADAATGALEQAQSTLKLAEEELSPDSELYYRLTSTLEEFSAMARSMRVLANYLEQHPEALLQGKGTAGAK